MSKQLPKLENDILSYLSQNAEWCHSYRSLEGYLGVKREYLEPAIKRLKEKGYLEHHRGLMTDDGEVAANGNCAAAIVDARATIGACDYAGRPCATCKHANASDAKITASHQRAGNRAARDVAGVCGIRGRGSGKRDAARFRHDDDAC